MNVKIPEKYRKEFDISADFAVEKQSFKPSELAEHLGTGVLVASIMVGYMEKAEFVSKGKNDDVRRAAISADEWEAIGRNIDMYEPKVKLILDDIITKPLQFTNKLLFVKEDKIIISKGEEEISFLAENVKTIFIKKGFWLFKGCITFSQDTEMPVKAKKRSDSMLFKACDLDSVRALADRLAERLGIKVIEY